MNQSSIQQIVTAITPLAHKIGQDGQVVWQAEYRQVYINAITSIICWGIALIIAVLAWTVLSRYFNKRYQEEKENKGYDVGLFLGRRIATHIVSAFISLCLFSIVIANGVEPLVNPVYQAFSNITSQLIPPPQGN